MKIKLYIAQRQIQKEIDLFPFYRGYLQERINKHLKYFQPSTLVQWDICVYKDVISIVHETKLKLCRHVSLSTSYDYIIS